MVGEVIAGRYELEEVVGSGGMSSVYRARDRLLERTVALKVLHDSHLADEEKIERFRREARAVAQLSHRNIVTVIDRGEEDGRQFIVFEFVEGESLKELVQRTGPLPVERALELAIEIGRALAFAHQSGLVHRDVKPQNVLLNGDGEAKVTDFGIARSLALDAVTQTGTVLGTSEYIAPEQASGQHVDVYSDVYSLGVVLFELLTGDVPYTGESFLAVTMRHLHDPVPDVRALRSDVPPRVAAAVERALAKDPGDRFRSMGEFVVELEHCLAELEEPDDSEATFVAPAPAAAVQAKRRSPRPRTATVALALAGLIAAAAATAAVVAFLSGSEPFEVGAQPPAAQPGGSSVELAAVGAYDPEGDGQEHPEDVPKATDGSPETYWTTERYRDFARLKSGVGLVLDAGEPVALDRITVTTPTPGFTARIDAGASPSGPFRAVAGEQTVAGTATFRVRGDEAQYFVVWITDIPSGVARISEVEAEAR